MNNPLLHAVNFPKISFKTLTSAKKYYSQHFKQPVDHTSVMKNFFRITTIYTKEFLKRNKYTNYVTKKLPNGVELVLTYK
jgi:hypothetical protein